MAVHYVETPGLHFPLVCLGVASLIKHALCSICLSYTHILPTYAWAVCSKTINTKSNDPPIGRNHVPRATYITYTTWRRSQLIALKALCACFSTCSPLVVCSRFGNISILVVAKSWTTNYCAHLAAGVSGHCVRIVMVECGVCGGRTSLFGRFVSGSRSISNKPFVCWSREFIYA